MQKLIAMLTLKMVPSGFLIGSQLRIGSGCFGMIGFFPGVVVLPRRGGGGAVGTGGTPDGND